MSAYLLTWNPKVFPFENFNKLMESVKLYGDIVSNWSVCSSKPKKGDDFYLMMVGQGKMNGLIGKGKILSEPYLLRKNGRRKYVDVSFQRLEDYKTGNVIEQTILKEVCPGQCWSPQCSGIQIKEEYASLLSHLWKN